MNLELPKQDRRLRRATLIGSQTLFEQYEGGPTVLWNLSQGRSIDKFEQEIRDQPFRYEDSTSELYVIQKGKIAKLKSSATGLTSEILPIEGPVTSAAFNTASNTMYFGRSNGEILCTDGAGSRRWSKKTGTESIIAIAIEKGGKLIATLNDANSLTLLDALGQTLGTLSDVKQLAGFDVSRRLYVLTQENRLKKISADGRVSDVSASTPSGDLASIESSTDTARLALLKNGQLQQLSSDKWSLVDTDVGYTTFLTDRRFLYVKNNGVAFVRDIGADHYLLTIFEGKHGWVAVDHEGRYDGTVSGARDVIWRAGQESLSLDQFFESYFRPGLLAAYLNDQQNTLGQVPSNPTAGAFLPPKVDLEFPEGKFVLGKEQKILAVAESRGGKLAGNISVFHNGKRLPPKSQLGSQYVEKDGRALLIQVFAFVPEPGANEIFAEARNSHGISNTSAVTKEVIGSGRSDGTLRLLSIGVDIYKAPGFTLNFARSDAATLSDQLSVQGKKIYSRVDSQALYDREATREGILKTLAGLATAKPEDSIIVILAGHGTTADGEWYFLPHDVSPSNIGRTSLSAKALEDALITSPAKRIMLVIDACNSGASIDTFNRYRDFQRRFVQQIGRTAGVTVLTAARRDQFASESDILGHGLFTFLLLDGMSGAADNLPRDGWITAHELAAYVGDNMERRGSMLLNDGTYAQAAKERINSRLGARSFDKLELEKAQASVMSQTPSYFVIGADFPLGSTK